MSPTSKPTSVYRIQAKPEVPRKLPWHARLIVWLNCAKLNQHNYYVLTIQRCEGWYDADRIYLKCAICGEEASHDHWPEDGVLPQPSQPSWDTALAQVFQYTVARIRQHP